MTGTDEAKAWFDQGTVLFEVEQHEEAIAYFDKVVAVQPSHSSAWISRANALTSLGRIEEAIHSLDMALEFNPALRTEVMRDFSRRGAEIVEAFEKKVEELNQKQEEIGFDSESEREEYYRNGQEIIRSVEEGVAEIQQVFPSDAQ